MLYGGEEMKQRFVLLCVCEGKKCTPGEETGRLWGSRKAWGDGWRDIVRWWPRWCGDLASTGSTAAQANKVCTVLKRRVLVPFFQLCILHLHLMQTWWSNIITTLLHVFHSVDLFVYLMGCNDNLTQQHPHQACAKSYVHDTSPSPF